MIVTAPPKYSLVLPAYNEVDNIRPMMERLAPIVAELDADCEIIWVDDGSTDGTSDLLDQLAEANPRVQVLHLSRNFGHMAALTAGLEASRATGAVITLDADGQHPPELIPDMLRLWADGADIVQTVRTATKGEPALKRVTSKGFYFLMNRLADIQLPEGAADFRLLDRQAVDALNNLPERVRFMRGLVQWVGFQAETIPYQAGARTAGQSKYGLGKMVLFALGAITSFSVRPLRLTFVLGLIVLLLTGIYGTYVLVQFARDANLVTGWTSLLLSVLFLGGIQLLTLGVASEYLGRIYEEAKGRPIYILKKPRPREQ